MAATKRKVARKANAGTKKDIIFSILDQNPDISTDDALKELKRRKVPMGEKPKQNYYSVKTLWKQGRGKSATRRPGKSGKPKRKYTRRVVEQPTGMETEVELQILRAENARLKAAIAVLLS